MVQCCDGDGFPSLSLTKIELAQSHRTCSTARNHMELIMFKRMTRNDARLREN